MFLTISQLKEATISYLLHESDLRKEGKPPTLPSFTDEQLRQAILDLLKTQ